MNRMVNERDQIGVDLKDSLHIRVKSVDMYYNYNIEGENLYTNSKVATKYIHRKY